MESEILKKPGGRVAEPWTLDQVPFPLGIRLKGTTGWDYASITNHGTILTSQGEVTLEDLANNYEQWNGKPYHRED